MPDALNLSAPASIVTGAQTWTRLAASHHLTEDHLTETRLLTEGLTAHNQAFRDRWHTFVATRDETQLPDLLAQTVELHTPLYWKVRQGRAEVALLLGAVVNVFGPLEYRREWLSGDE